MDLRETSILYSLQLPKQKSRTAQALGTRLARGCKLSSRDHDDKKQTQTPEESKRGQRIAKEQGKKRYEGQQKKKKENKGKGNVRSLRLIFGLARCQIREGGLDETG